MLGFGLVKNEADIDPAAMQLFKQNGVCTKLNDLARVRGSVSGLDLQRNVRTVFKFQYSVADAMKGRIRRIEGDFRFQSVRPPRCELGEIPSLEQLFDPLMHCNSRFYPGCAGRM